MANNKQNYNDLIQLHNICDIKLRHYRRKYPIPKFTTRLPFKRNPLDITVGDDDGAAADELHQWLYQQFPTSHISLENYRKLATNSELVTAYLYPLCIEKDRYYQILQHMIYFFIMDDNTEEPWGRLTSDHMDECRRVWSQVSQLFRNISYGDQTDSRSHGIDDMETYIRQIQPTFANIYQSLNDKQWCRFADSWLDYVSGNIVENQAKGRQRFLSVDQLLSIRRKTIGLLPTAISLEYAYNIEIPEPEWLDPRMRLLLQLINDHVVYVNDLFSFEKELRANIRQLFKGADSLVDDNDDDYHRQVFPQIANTVAQTALELRCSILEAQTMIIKRIEQLEIEIIKLLGNWQQSDGPSQLSPGGLQFIRGLVYIPGGNYRFSLSVDRYNKFE